MNTYSSLNKNLIDNEFKLNRQDEEAFFLGLLFVVVAGLIIVSFVIPLAKKAIPSSSLVLNVKTLPLK